MADEKVIIKIEVNKPEVIQDFKDISKAGQKAAEAIGKAFSKTADKNSKSAQKVLSSQLRINEKIVAAEIASNRKRKQSAEQLARAQKRAQDKMVRDNARAFKKQEADVKRAYRNMGRGIDKFASRAKIALLGISAVTVALGKAGVDAFAELEQLELGFGTIFGAEAGASLFGTVQEFAIETSFEAAPIAQAIQLMGAFGTAVDAIPNKLLRIGDAAAVFGVGIRDAIEIFSRAGAGTIIGRTAIRLGITPQGAGEIRAAFKTGGRGAAEDVFFEKIEKFSGFMLEQAKTLAIVLQNFGDALKFGLFKPIGEALAPAIKAVTEAFVRAMDRGVFESAVEGFGNLADMLADKVVPWLNKLTAQDVQNGLTVLKNSVMGIAGVVVGNEFAKGIGALTQFVTSIATVTAVRGLAGTAAGAGIGAAAGTGTGVLVGAKGMSASQLAAARAAALAPLQRQQATSITAFQSALNEQRAQQGIVDELFVRSGGAIRGELPAGVTQNVELTRDALTAADDNLAKFATEFDDIAKGVEKGTKTARPISKFLSKAGAGLKTFGRVLSKWAAPISIAIELLTTAVSNWGSITTTFKRLVNSSKRVGKAFADEWEKFENTELGQFSIQLVGSIGTGIEFAADTVVTVFESVFALAADLMEQVGEDTRTELEKGEDALNAAATGAASAIGQTWQNFLTRRVLEFNDLFGEDGGVVGLINFGGERTPEQVRLLAAARAGKDINAVFGGERIGDAAGVQADKRLQSSAAILGNREAALSAVGIFISPRDLLSGATNPVMDLSDTDFESFITNRLESRFNIGGEGAVAPAGGGGKGKTPIELATEAIASALQKQRLDEIRGNILTTGVIPAGLKNLTLSPQELLDLSVAYGISLNDTIGLVDDLNDALEKRGKNLQSGIQQAFDAQKKIAKERESFIGNLGKINAEFDEFGIVSKQFKLDAIEFSDDIKLIGGALDPEQIKAIFLGTPQQIADSLSSISMETFNALNDVAVAGSAAAIALGMLANDIITDILPAGISGQPGVFAGETIRNLLLDPNVDINRKNQLLQNIVPIEGQDLFVTRGQGDPQTGFWTKVSCAGDLGCYWQNSITNETQLFGKGVDPNTSTNAGRAAEKARQDAARKAEEAARLRKQRIQREQQLFAAPFQAAAGQLFVEGGDPLGAFGAAAGTSIGGLIGGPFGGIIGTLASGVLGKIFGKKKTQPTNIQPLPVKVVNFSDMLSQLANITKSNRISANAVGINRLNNVRIQRNRASI